MAFFLPFELLPFHFLSPFFVSLRHCAAILATIVGTSGGDAVTAHSDRIGTLTPNVGEQSGRNWCYCVKAESEQGRAPRKHLYRPKERTKELNLREAVVLCFSVQILLVHATRCLVPVYCWR